MGKRNQNRDVILLSVCAMVTILLCQAITMSTESDFWNQVPLSSTILVAMHMLWPAVGIIFGFFFSSRALGSLLEARRTRSANSPRIVAKTLLVIAWGLTVFYTVFCAYPVIRDLPLISRILESL